ncbi:MAG TPA: 7-cyano-7-deazaguanine synthase [Vicinamibacterales bacterium]
MVPAVLFSSGLDSAVLLVDAAARYGGAQPIYVSAGLGWEASERRVAERFLAALPAASNIRPLVSLTVDMRDVYPPTHWAVRGEAPGFDTPDTDVYIEGRNVVLLSKASVFVARERLQRILIGPLAGNPFPDASPAFFEAMSRALSLGLGAPITIEAPLLGMQKEDVIVRGRELAVPFELTLSCMQPVDDRHCGQCSKCRERRDAFRAAGLEDPAPYAAKPVR